MVSTSNEGTTLLPKTLIVAPTFALVLGACGGGGAESVTVVDTSDTLAPSSPTDLTANAVSLTQIDLTWNASSDNVRVIGYGVYRGGVLVGTTTTTSYSDVGLLPGTNYNFTVTASDAAGNVSAPSGVLIAASVPDTTAPLAPTGLAAVASGTEITLTWNATSDNVGVTGYRVFRNSVEVGAPTDNTFFDSGLSAANIYNYTVSARDAAGNESAQSNIANASIPDTAAPTVPGALSATAAGPGSIALSWSAATDNVAVTTYAVHRNGVQIATPANNSFTDIGMSAATIYNYTVSARDAAGNESAQSSVANASIPDTTAPSAPSALSAVVSGTGSINLSWSATGDNVGVTTYVVRRNGVPIATPARTSFTDTGLNAAAAHSYTVSARDAANNESGESVAASATIPDTAAPSVPSTLSATAAGTDRIALSWSASNDNVAVTAYVVRRNGVQIATPATNSFTDTGLSAETAYNYTVSARDAAGNASAQSGPASATIPDTIEPAVPGGLKATVSGTDTINLTWSAASDNVAVTAYVIRRNGAQIATSATNNFTDTGLNAATAYDYTVSARDAAGNVSSDSGFIIATTDVPPDMTAPSAPTVLSADVSGPDAINLTWSTASDNIAVTRYRIFRDGTEIGISNTTGFSDSGLNVAVEYDYTVSARDAAGNESAQSGPASVTIPDTTAPSTPSELSAVVSGTDSINLSWSAADDNVAVTAYVIRRNGVPITTPASSSVTDTGLNAATAYSYTVSARDAAGNESGESSAASATIPDTAAPSVPGTPAATVAGTDSITLSWSTSNDNVAVSDYVVRRDGEQIATPATNSFTDTGRNAVTKYSYTVSARDAARNESAQSSPASATIPDTVAPIVPDGLKATVSGTDTINLTWSAASDNVAVTAYRIFRDGTPIATSATNSFTDSGLSAATTYDYTVSALDTAGNESAQSSAAGVTIPDTTEPTAPGNLTATIAGVASIALSWSASSDNVAVTAYVVRRNGVQIATPASNSFTDTGLSALTTYSYTVSARDVAGNISAQSSVATAIIPDTTAPVDVSGLSATVAGTNSIALSWTASTDNVGVTAYRIFRNGIEVGISTVTGYIDTGLSPGFTYSYTVVAYDAASNASRLSAALHQTTDATPGTTVVSCGAPTTPGGGAPGDPNTATLTWNAITHPDLCGYRIYYAVGPVPPTQYRVERCQGAGCANFVQVATLTTGTNYNDTSLDPSTSYSYRVLAASATGTLSSYSDVASQTTLAAPPTPGLVAAYGFDEVPGTPVADASGNDNIGTMAASVGTAPGRFGNALVFDGASARVIIPNSASLELATAMTLEAWVYPTVALTDFRMVVAKGPLDYYLSASTSSDHNTAPSAGGIFVAGQPRVFGLGGLAVNAWTHLAATFDGTTLQLYVDGVQVASEPHTASLLPDTGPLRIGASSFGNFFVGRIDEVRVYNRALSMAEIQTDMTTPIVSDSVPPSVPAALAAVGVSGTQINLAWGASSDNVGVSNYRVERCTGSPCVFVEMPRPTGTTYNDIAGLFPNTMYYYQVRAEDAAGNLSGSAIASASTLAPDTTSPSTPTGLTAAGASGTQVNLAWSPSTDDFGVSYYRVERCTGIPCVFVEIAASTGTTYNDMTGLAANTAYQYQVRAVDAAGNLSPFSNVATTSTLTLGVIAPSAPVGLTAVAVSNTQIRLAWSMLTTSGSYLQPLGQGINAGNATTYTLTGLGSGNRYYFAITAFDAANNESGFSNEVFKDIP